MAAGPAASIGCGSLSRATKAAATARSLPFTADQLLTSTTWQQPTRKMTCNGLRTRTTISLKTRTGLQQQQQQLLLLLVLLIIVGGVAVVRLVTRELCSVDSNNRTSMQRLINSKTPQLHPLSRSMLPVKLPWCSASPWVQRLRLKHPIMPSSTTQPVLLVDYQDTKEEEAEADSHWPAEVGE